MNPDCALDHVRIHFRGAAAAEWEPDEAILLDALERIGVAAQGETIQELLASFHILRTWSMPLEVQLASLFRPAAAARANPEKLASIIGDAAQQLVFLASEIALKTVVDTLFITEPGEPAPPIRQATGSITLSTGTLLQLCALHIGALAGRSAREDGSPGFWIIRASRALAAMDRHQPLHGPLLELAGTISPGLERRCRQAYDDGVGLLRSDLAAAKAHFLEAAALLINAEPLCFAAAISLWTGEVDESRRLCRGALQRLDSFGIAWDKRRSLAKWRDMAMRLHDGDCPAAITDLFEQAGTVHANKGAARPMPPRSRFDEYLLRLSNYPLTGKDTSRFYPDLEQVRVHPPERFAVVAQLEQNWPAIAQEIDNLGRAGFRDESQEIGRSGSWEVLMLYDRGRRMEEHCARCPTIDRIIQSRECMRTLTGMIYVSRLAPGTRISSHFGPTNLRLRCHLGIKVPDQACGLEVGGLVSAWRAGKCLVFDDSFEHSAWNVSEQERIVLIVDLWHPGLSREEIVLLSGLQEYAALVGPGLAEYWNKVRVSETGRRTQYD